MRKSEFTERTDHQGTKGTLPECRQAICAASTAPVTTPFSKWRSRLAGWSTDARKLNALEDEKRKLKNLLAESMLEVTTRKEMLGKNF